jgi:hypothetical protein
MPLKKLTLKAGVNQENTRYYNENGWYQSDKVRFRQGTPEKIGGWTRISSNFFNGVCRSLWNWATTDGTNILGIGTNQKFYFETFGAYYNITPLRSTVVLSNPFATTINLPTVVVTSVAHGGSTGDWVTFSGASVVGGLDLNNEYQITVLTVDTYQITASSNATSTVPAGGGATVTAKYQISIGLEIATPGKGWGSGGWGKGTWGYGATSPKGMRIWSQANFGDNLVYGYNGSSIYYWSYATSLTPGVLLSSTGGTVTLTIASPCVITLSTALPAGSSIKLATTGALPTGLTAGTTYYLINVSGLTANLSATSGGSAINTSGTQSGVQSISVLGDVPSIQNFVYVSDTSRFIFAFGCNDYGTATQSPMLVRWSDQENPTVWYPAATNQAGSVLLSHGSKIVTAIQARQEIVTFTDSSVYSLQYQGAPVVWSSQLVGDNISIAGQNAVAQASGRVYWMGVDKFYVYDGRVQTLRCDLRQFVFGNINQYQITQTYAGTNEGFNEVWWFYCSANSNYIDRYVVYNYFENNGEGVWYYGTMSRPAWLDSGLRPYPMAATYSSTTQLGNILYHENGVDDNATSTTLPIESYITSSEFDLDDGHNFAFVWRVLPDVTFRGSTVTYPQLTMQLLPLKNSGSGYNDPLSVSGSSSADVTRIAEFPVETYTGQVFIRVRGRQLALKIISTGLGVQWQLGAPRVDMRLDGRR